MGGVMSFRFWLVLVLWGAASFAVSTTLLWMFAP